MIAVYISPENMTQDQYEAVGQRMSELQPPVEARKHHSSFGEGGHVMVYEVWESQEAWDAFAAVLMPLLDEIGIKLNRPPDTMPVIRLMQ